MTIITTLQTIEAIEKMVNSNSHLIEENDIITVKSYYNTKTYKKIKGIMVWNILPTKLNN